MDDDDDPELQAALKASMETAQPQPMQTDDDEEELRAAIALSMQPAAVVLGGAPGGAPAEPAAPPADLQPLPPMGVEPEPSAEALSALIFGAAPSDAVLRQWGAQGVCVAAPQAEVPAGAVSFTAGLAQSQGGPCAVLAAAQAFLVRRLLFDPSPAAPRAAAETAWLDATPGAATGLAAVDALRAPPEAVRSALLSGLADVLWEAAHAEPIAAEAAAVVALPPDDALPYVGSAAALPALLLLHRERCASWEATRSALARGLAALGSEVGALALLCSALLTRGLCRVAAERDDTGIPLVDPIHGHCSQEVLNLLLLGQATSNVFDGERDLGGDIRLRGVRARPAVGLLSQLEALRYLEVGALFKRPASPIWVIASESHYTLLFACDGAVQEVSALAAVEEQMLAAFSRYDTEGNGFISAEHVAALAAALPEWATPPAEQLQRDLDPEGTSLVVWDRFRTVMLPLHPHAAELAARADAAGAAAGPLPPPATLTLLHYNGLASTGHAHKRALRVVRVTPGDARGQPMSTDGLAACVLTRWTDAAVSWEGAAPSIL